MEVLADKESIVMLPEGTFIIIYEELFSRVVAHAQLMLHLPADQCHLQPPGLQAFTTRKPEGPAVGVNFTAQHITYISLSTLSTQVHTSIA